MEPDDLLCSRNARPPKALARAHGTSRRAVEGGLRKLRAVGGHPTRSQGNKKMYVAPCAQGRSSSVPQSDIRQPVRFTKSTELNLTPPTTSSLKEKLTIRMDHPFHRLG